MDFEAYHRNAREGPPCFVCELVAGRRPHDVVYEDGGAIAFLDRYPVLRGYTLVAPKRHAEEVTGDFTENEYLELQRVVRRVGEALRKSVSTERLFIASLGSKQGNAEEQQLAALDWGANGERVLTLADAEQEELVARIRASL